MYQFLSKIFIIIIAVFKELQKYNGDMQVMLDVVQKCLQVNT